MEPITISKKELREIVSQGVNEGLDDFFKKYNDILKISNFRGFEELSEKEKLEIEELKKEESYSIDEVF
ncbi:MAG: hypothetical protein ACLFPL_04020 [Candidatus Nanoarchaeia archaeon]